MMGVVGNTACMHACMHARSKLVPLMAYIALTRSDTHKMFIILAQLIF